MPYIAQKDRLKYIEILKTIDAIPEIVTKGDLEFLVFKLMKKYMETRDYRYTELHNVSYAVQHASDEFRRRYLDIREDEARENNGDI